MGEWIPVHERLPGEPERWGVLVVCRTHGGYEGSYVSVQKAIFYPDMPGDENSAPTHHYFEVEDAQMNIPFEITHWMPIPEVPDA